MKPEIKILPEKKLIGQNIQMSYADNRTFELWKNFMPRRKEIQNNVNEYLFSLQEYPPLFFDKHHPTTSFEKWAAVEVTDFSVVPADMKTLVLEGGLYAVWNFTGTSVNASLFFEKLFKIWLPEAGYQPDNRFHFEILGDKYNRDDPASEEEVWVPVRIK